MTTLRNHGPVPEEVDELAVALVRACQKNGVCFTGFVFSAKPTFINHYTNLIDSEENLHKVHEMIFEQRRAGAISVPLHQNDA